MNWGKNKVIWIKIYKVKSEKKNYENLWMKWRGIEIEIKEIEIIFNG